MGIPITPDHEIIKEALEKIVELIDLTLSNPDSDELLTNISNKVHELCENFPIYKDLLRSHLKSDNNVAILSFFSIGEPNIILKNESIPRPLQTSLNSF